MNGVLMKNILVHAQIKLVFIIFLILSTSVFAQNNKPRTSPKAGVMQTIRLTEVEITYSRPGVKERTIWGKLVPYNAVWRAGADEATKFTFSTDVNIEGKKLSAGSYSFFAIPGEKEWTLIFNKVADQWGAFEYNIAQDALRITIKPQQVEHTEWLEYSFSNLTPNSAVCTLQWEKIKVPFKIEAAGK
jgi:hypothetical protein